MTKVKERIVAELHFTHNAMALTIAKIDDNVIELGCTSRIFDNKGEQFLSKRLTAKEDIKNLGAYVYTYLSRTLKWNKDLMLIRVSGESYNFKHIHNHSSGSTFIASAKQKNGIPAYTRSDCINKILYYSGTETYHRTTEELIPYLNDNLSSIAMVSKAMRESGVETIRYYFLKELVETHNEQSEISKTLKMANSLYKRLGNNSEFAKSHRQIGVSGSFSENRVITLNPEWFE